ncbi:MAG: hypothetical protein ACPGN5_04400, partial [Porticoccaceae bacterium]
LAPLLADNFHLVSYDLSGMGDSGARDSYPDDVRAAEMVEVARDEQQIQAFEQQLAAAGFSDISVKVLLKDGAPVAWNIKAK